MSNEQLKKEIEKILSTMGCVDVIFNEEKSDVLIVNFNSKDLTSFVANVDGWTYSGIQIDTTGKRQYKIEFYKPH